jgi:predicted glycosyltransferase
MKYFFLLNHPAHFHLFKNVIKILGAKGHLCFIYIRPKDVLENLLREEGFDFKILTSPAKKRKFIIGSSITGLLKKEFKLSKYVLKHKPDLLIGTDWAIVHVGRLFNIPSLVFNEDDTLATPENKIFYPFAKTLVIPECCDKGMWEKKRVSYNGYHELAYLDPNHFMPDKNIVNENLRTNKPYIIIRLVKLTASHDVGKKGLGLSIILQLIKKYEKDYDFLVSMEENIIPELEKYRFGFNLNLMHHFIANAALVISDSQTMVAEAAVLGTPSVRFNDFVGKIGYLEELEHKYELTYGIQTSKPNELIEKIEELLTLPGLKNVWNSRKHNMLEEKIDVTAFMDWFIETYPESKITMRSSPDYQYKFKTMIDG